MAVLLAMVAQATVPASHLMAVLLAMVQVRHTALAMTVTVTEIVTHGTVLRMR